MKCLYCKRELTRVYKGKTYDMFKCLDENKCLPDKHILELTILK